MGAEVPAKLAIDSVHSTKQTKWSFISLRMKASFVKSFEVEGREELERWIFPFVGQQH